MSDFLNQQNMYWQGEANSKANELIHKSNEAHNANIARDEAEKKAKAAAEEVKHYENEVDYFVDLGEKLLKKLNDTEKELQFYKDLLSKPLREISKHHAGFKSSYEADNEIMAIWMVSYHSTREVALNLAQQLGKSDIEFSQLLKQANKDVLENKTKFGNDAKNINFLLPYMDSLKKRMT